MTLSYPTLKLKRHHDRRLQSGHVWIYSNEVDVELTPLNQFKPGDLVTVKNNRDECLGVATFNPHCLLGGRLLSRTARTIDVSFFIEKIKAALSLRERFYSTPFYRLIFAEGDGLPGLIVDRYGDTLVIQLNTAGMDKLQPLVIEALQQVISPKRIVLRNDSPARETEGLTLHKTVVMGDESSPLLIEENGARFEAPLLDGQKTGWFFDHRDNRAHLLPLVAGKSVLDVCCYLGAFGIQAAKAGASAVTFIDSSASAIRAVEHHAKLNQVSARIETYCEAAFTAMEKLINAGKKFDVIVLDPPAFIKSKKDKPTGLKAYEKLNRLGLKLLNPNGLLLSASCSMHLSADDLLTVVQSASSKMNAMPRILATWHQSFDHPISVMIPETRYLKALLLTV
ncbi:MAG: class I SAM-dependent rRNA methyltransferase [Gammaproteobacteria bacterium]|nr:class I SAM-dependent rRNA methyltransferase [Gammaproteobacteria bacterium]